MVTTKGISIKVINVNNGDIAMVECYDCKTSFPKRIQTGTYSNNKQDSYVLCDDCLLKFDKQ